MKRVFVCTMLVLVTVGCSDSGGGRVTGSSNLVTVAKDFAGFTRVELTEGFRGIITRSDDTAVTLTVSYNIEKYLDVRMSGSILSIGLEDSNTYIDPYIVAAIAIPDLELLSVSGGASATMTGFSLDHAFECAASGAGSLMMTGSCERLTLTSSGGSIIDAGAFTSADTSVSVSGGSTATVKPTGLLSGTVDGGSQLLYYGSPSAIDVATTGDSSISKAE